MKPRKRGKVQRRMKKSHAKPQRRKEGKRKSEGDKRAYLLLLLLLFLPLRLCGFA
jgi:hypothetical protein